MAGAAAATLCKKTRRSVDSIIDNLPAFVVMVGRRHCTSDTRREPRRRQSVQWLRRKGAKMAELSPQQQISRMLSGYWVSQAVYVAAKLGLADLLKDAPRTAADLASVTKSHPRSL